MLTCEPQVERESLNFGSIAAKVLGTQEALNDINKVMFPTLEQLPSVPDSLFKADMLSTASANDRPLRVLSLGRSHSPPNLIKIDEDYSDHE